MRHDVLINKSCALFAHLHPSRVNKCISVYILRITLSRRKPAIKAFTVMLDCFSVFLSVSPSVLCFIIMSSVLHQVHLIRILYCISAGLTHQVWNTEPCITVPFCFCDMASPQPVCFMRWCDGKGKIWMWYSANVYTWYDLLIHKVRPWWLGSVGWTSWAEVKCWVAAASGCGLITRGLLVERKSGLSKSKQD